MNETLSDFDSSTFTPISSSDVITINASNESQVICPSVTPEDFMLLDQFRHWVGGVGVCIVSITGFILNLGAVCVLLTRLSNHNNFNQLMVILFVLDSFYLLLSVITTVQRRFGLKNRTLTIIYPKFTYPISSISLTLSIFMTVGMAHERYIAIKYPITHRQRMISAKFRRINLLKYMVSIVFCAVGFNVPKFFEAELIWINPPEITNMTNVNSTDTRYPDNRSEFLLEPAVTPSEMRMNPMYSIYYINPATFVVLGILPLILLAYWNFNIYKQIKSVSSWAEQNASRPSRSHQENELARVLIGIVITFVCCHALRILLNFHEAITIKDIMACHAEGKEGIPLWPQITNEFSKLMLVTNSSANIIIYCCLNSNFRKNIMSCLKQRGDSSNEASTQHATGKNLTKVATTYC